MSEFLSALFSSDFMPHGYCYLWKPEIVWLHALSDGGITLAYYLIVDLAHVTRVMIMGELAASIAHEVNQPLTAHRDEVARAQALQAGAVDFLSKPFSEEALLTAVHAALEAASCF